MIGTVFISHKHEDHAIAAALAEFLREISGNRVRVFLSSDSRFEGPRLGGDLNQELIEAIGQSGIVVMIYTGRSRNIDWDYCIHECSVAMTQGLRVIVLQCGDEAPSPFLNQVRVEVGDLTAIQRLVQDFMTSDNFFRGQLEKVTDYSPDAPEVKTKAADLYAALKNAVTKVPGAPKEWSAWPWVRIRFEKPSVEAIESAEPDRRSDAVRNQLQTNTLVVASRDADRVFGIGVESGLGFEVLIDGWRESRSGASDEWLKSLSYQLGEFMKSHFPRLRDVRIPSAHGGKQLMPIVTRTLRYPERVEADIYFYDFRPRAKVVSEVMTPKSLMYYLKSDNASTPLRDVYRDMREREADRVPIVDSAGLGRTVIDRNELAAMIVDAGSEELSLEDMLEPEDSIKQDARPTSVVWVGLEDSLEEVRRKLGEAGGPCTVFVTPKGKPDEPLMGILKHTDLNETS